MGHATGEQRGSYGHPFKDGIGDPERVTVENGKVGDIANAQAGAATS